MKKTFGVMLVYDRRLKFQCQFESITKNDEL